MTNVDIQIIGMISLPQTVYLPASVAARSQVPRKLTISGRTLRVPQEVASWLKADPRYKGWIEGDVIVNNLTDQQEVPVAPQLTAVAAPPPDDDQQQGDEQPDDDQQQPDDPPPSTGQVQVIDATKAVTGTPPVTPLATPELWSRAWRMVDLRSYAAKYGVELTSEDTKKEDVIAKIAAAGLPEDTSA